jgi:hypothetical protein
MLVLLRMVYPRGSIKFHIISIVPVTVDNEINLHIVEGCHPEKKTIPLNKANLIWCCGECESYSVHQFEAFVLGEKRLSKSSKKLLSNATQLTVTNRRILKMLTLEKHYQHQLHLNLKRERGDKISGKEQINQFYLNLNNG